MYKILVLQARYEIFTDPDFYITPTPLEQEEPQSKKVTIQKPTTAIIDSANNSATVTATRKMKKK